MKRSNCRELITRLAIPDELKLVFGDFDRVYYLCANRYFEFISVHPNAHSAGTLPCDKFNGIVAHLFDILTRQSSELSRLIVHLERLDTQHNTRFVSHLARAARFEAEFERQLERHRAFVAEAESARNLVEQTDGFRELVCCGGGGFAASIVKSFAAIRDDFEEFRKTIRDRYSHADEFEFAFCKNQPDQK